jgi:hypothetical protein
VTQPQDPIIRASEIGQYAYCARAWWLGRIKGYRSTNEAAMRAGSEAHHDHGRAVESYHRLRRLATVLIIVAALALAVWLLLVVGR